MRPFETNQLCKSGGRPVRRIPWTCLPPKAERKAPKVRDTTPCGTPASAKVGHPDTCPCAKLQGRSVCLHCHRTPGRPGLQIGDNPRPQTRQTLGHRRPAILPEFHKTERPTGCPVRLACTATPLVISLSGRFCCSASTREAQDPLILRRHRQFDDISEV